MSRIDGLEVTELFHKILDIERRNTKVRSFQM